MSHVAISDYPCDTSRRHELRATGTRLCFEDGGCRTYQSHQCRYCGLVVEVEAASMARKALMTPEATWSAFPEVAARV